MQAIENRNVYKPLELTSWQRQVLEALEVTETEKYPLSRWYHGALYALDNPNNPDRVSQAAQSLRELVEKLSGVVLGINIQSSHIKSIFETKRGDIEKHILTYKESHPGDWEGQTIDSHLANGLTTLEEYLKLNKQPSRAEKIANAVTSIDPMFNRLDSQTQMAKLKQLRNLWHELEGFAHHNSKTEEEFRTYLEALEKTVFYLLAPITAQDQREIQTILKRPNRSAGDIEQMFSLIERRGANFAFFFKHASETADATWLPLLNERGYFANPPSAQRNNDGWEIFPFWWPINYLAKIANQVPDETIKIVQNLPEVDNPNIYKEILEIALQLHSEQSAKLKREILKSTKINDQLLAYKYAELLAHWTAENQTSTALELTRMLVKFAPDPQSEAKQKCRKENPTDLGTFWETSLEPLPRIGRWEYDEIMSKGVRPLAEKEPYQVARLLTKATANMIRMRTHQADMDQEEDYSEAWCERLRGLDTGYGAPEKTLVHTLTFACEKVYEKPPDSVVVLDKILRDQRWGIFKRLRQHLYAQYPNEQTKPWIQELILEHKDYHLWEHRYEFQRMIRRACKHFGASLLTEDECAHIFDAIRSGPPKEDFQEWLGEEFTEEKFLQHQHYFHQKQLKPFEPLLFGEYTTYFRELEVAENNPISDEDYSPFEIQASNTPVSNGSPCTSDDLARLTDEELIIYIYEWEKQGGIVDFAIEGLATTLQTFFKETIIPNANRLRFWLDNLRRMQPIYARAMIEGMRVHVKGRNFDNLNECLTFSEWILSHTNRDEYKLNDKSQENREWYNLREIVGGFIKTCLEKEVDVPVAAREQLAKLLEMLCTQFDRHLDQKEANLLIQNDLIDEAINNTRGRALEALLQFGLWLQRQDSASEALEVTTILEKRFVPEVERPLTLPEYAILGRDYHAIFSLNKVWAAEHKSDLFPQDKLPAWLAAFSSFLHYNPPFERTFEIFRNDLDFALQHLTDLKKQDGSNKEQTDIFGHPLKQNSPKEKLMKDLGRHLFNYYLWKMYPLRRLVRNKERFTPLERYYQATSNNPERWANLFNYVGRMLWKTREQLDKDLEDRIIAFFNWRVNEKEPAELRQFTFWLQAKCLEAEWRLDAYFKILKVCKSDDLSINIQMEALCELLPDYTAKVIKCFTKLTDKIKKPS